jgi:hypothetical protein
VRAPVTACESPSVKMYIIEIESLSFALHLLGCCCAWAA